MLPQFNKGRKRLQKQSLLKYLNSYKLNSTEIDPTQLEKDSDNNVLINILVEKLNVMGAYFASINNRKIANNRPQLNKLINSKLLERANNVTLCTFSCVNVADNPSVWEDISNYLSRPKRKIQKA